METKWMSYCFIDYSDFLIANSLHSPPWKSPSCFSNSTSKNAKLPDFRTTPNFQFSRVMLTAWTCVIDAVLSQIKKDRWEKFQSVSTDEKIIENLGKDDGMIEIIWKTFLYFLKTCFRLLVCLGLLGQLTNSLFR